MRSVLTPQPLNSAPAKADRSLQSVKLLTQREGYTTCHINVPEDSERLAAIALGGNFYSFFRSINDPAKTLGLLLKLALRGNQAALTPTSKGYAVWVYEPDGSLAPVSTRKVPRTIPPTFGPADCWIISDRQSGYFPCSLKVPDLPKKMPGITNGQKLYSLYRQEKEATTTLVTAARLCQRGDETIILVSKAGYAICVYEPEAVIVA